MNRTGLKRTGKLNLEPGKRMSPQSSAVLAVVINVMTVKQITEESKGRKSKQNISSSLKTGLRLFINKLAYYHYYCYFPF